MVAELTLASQVVESFREDRKSLLELIELIALEPQARALLATAALAELATRTQVEQTRQQLEQKIEQTRQQLEQKIEQLDRKIEQTRQQLDRKIEQTRQQLEQKIEQVRSELKGELGEVRREIHSYLRWTVGLIIVMWTTTLIPLLFKLVGLL